MNLTQGLPGCLCRPCKEGPFQGMVCFVLKQLSMDNLSPHYFYKFYLHFWQIFLCLCFSCCHCFMVCQNQQSKKSPNLSGCLCSDVSETALEEQQAAPINPGGFGSFPSWCLLGSSEHELTPFAWSVSHMAVLFAPRLGSRLWTSFKPHTNSHLLQSLEN